MFSKLSPNGKQSFGISNCLNLWEFLACDKCNQGLKEKLILILQCTSLSLANYYLIVINLHFLGLIIHQSFFSDQHLFFRVRKLKYSIFPLRQYSGIILYDFNCEYSFQTPVKWIQNRVVGRSLCKFAILYLFIV